MRDRPLVMVVEDDPEMNELERELLELGGMDTVPAYSGVEAIQLADRCNANAVLLDIMLPEMDGFETCRRLRDNAGEKLPIVLVTVLDSEDCRRRCVECGADALFTKPFDPDGVVNTIQSLLHRRGITPSPASRQR